MVDFYLFAFFFVDRFPLIILLKHIWKLYS